MQWKRIPLSVLLGIATPMLLAAALNLLPYSPATDTIHDALGMPGALIASLIYPEGVHTGHGSAVYWADVVIGFNSLLYSVFWYVCLRLIPYLRRRRRKHTSADP